MTDEVKEAEHIVSIAASGNAIYALSSAGRLWMSEVGRKALGWREVPGPLAEEATD